MRLIKTLILIGPALAIVPVGVLCFRSCADDDQDYVIIQKLHTPARFEPHTGQTLNPTWALVLKRDDGTPSTILQCSREGWEAFEVGDRPEVVTISNDGGIRVKRLVRDADADWRPIPYAPQKG